MSRNALEQDGRTRVIIENVTPRVDDGAFPIKRIVGDTVIVEADVFTDGHDAISCALLYKKEGDSAVDRSSDGAAGQRPLARLIQGSRNWALSLHGERLD